MADADQNLFGRHKSRKQSRKEWAAKVLGKCLEAQVAEGSDFGKLNVYLPEGIVEADEAPLARVNIEDEHTPPSLEWKRAFARRLQVDIPKCEKMFRHRTSGRKNDDGEEWG